MSSDSGHSPSNSVGRPFRLRWRKDQAGTVLLSVLIAIIGVAWLEPWVMWATRNAEPGRATPLLSPPLMIAIVLVSAVVTRWAATHSLVWKQMAVKVVVGALLAIVVIEVIVFGARPPRDFLLGFVTWNGFFSSEVIVLIATAILWVRGIFIGRADVLREDLEGMFYTGVFALVVLLIFDAARPIVPFADMFWSALIFFVTSLLALALVGPEHAHFWQRETSAVRLLLNRYWLLTIAGVISLIVVVALAFANSAGEDALSVLHSFVIAVVTLLAFALQIIMSVVVQIIVWLLTPIMPLLERLGVFLGQVMNQIRPPGPLTSPDGVASGAETVFNSALIAALTRGAVVVAIVMVFLFVLLLVLIRLGFIPTRHSDETRESIASRQLILGQLRSLLARRARRPAPMPSYLPLNGPPEDPRLMVRRAYQGLLEWARSHAVARAAHQTPTTYAETLTTAIPSQREPIATLTTTYVRARYGSEAAITADDAHAAQDALARLQSAAMIQSLSSEE